MTTTEPTTITEPEENRPTRTIKEYIGLVARGFAMGSADVVPGVSGGTMAFILGIYEELVIQYSGSRTTGILASAAQVPHQGRVCWPLTCPF